MKKKFFVVLFITMFFSLITNAQYSTSIGLRFGTFSGITVKHFIGSGNAVEGLATWYYNDGFVIGGLYEFQKPFPDVDNLYWYIGGGIHAGFGRYNHEKYEDEYFVFGGDAIIGLEYTFREVPFNIGIDWKPAVNFIGEDHFWIDDAAVSFRYYF